MSACPVCRAERSEDALTAYDRSVPRAGSFRYRRCLSCGLISLFPTPSAAAALRFYSEDYAPHAGGGRACTRRRSPWNRLVRETLLARRGPAGSPRILEPLARLLLRDLELPRGACRLLDVGCGGAKLLAQHRELGWDVQGVEPSASGAAACRAAGLPVQECELAEADLPEAHFDVVLLKHVVEHVPDPHAVLARARRLLVPGGQIVVATPNTAGVGLRLYGNCWYALDAPRHLHLFDAPCLRRLAEAVGLRVESISSIGSTRVLVRSRRYARMQGEHLATDITARSEIVRRTGEAGDDDRVFHRLASPFVALFALLGAGDTLRARFTRGSR